MSEPVETNLFLIIAQQMEQLAKELETESGDKIRDMGHAEGVIADVVRGCLDTINEILGMLYQMTDKAEDYVIAADALIATLELLADSIQAMGDSIRYTGMFEKLGLPREPFDQVGTAISTGGDMIEKGLEAAQIMPSPDDLQKIKQAIEKCLGASVNPELVPATPGLLIQLTMDVSAVSTETMAN